MNVQTNINLKPIIEVLAPLPVIGFLNLNKLIKKTDMNKEIFIEAIEAIQKQVALDIEVSKHLGKAFPDAFEANLLPKNHFLQNALLHVFQVEMNDLQLCEHGQSWIEYFLWELNFGEENYRLKVYDENKKEIPMSTAAELYDFLNNR